MYRAIVNWALASYHRFMSVRRKRISDEESLAHLRRAAELGDWWAQNKLGVRFATGNGVGQDQVEAVRWYRESAEAGNPLGAGNLGWAYQSGHGVTQNLEAAAEWYIRAARGGHAESQFNLALLYLNGSGVPRDREKAISLLKSASRRLTRAAELLSQLKSET